MNVTSEDVIVTKKKRKKYFNSHVYLLNLQHPVVKVKDARRTIKEVKLGEIKHHVFIYHLHKRDNIYLAFCAGSIIADDRVLTSTHCFLTNKKRKRKDINKIKVVAGILYTLAEESGSDDVQQWRSVLNVYSQRFFRFPAFNLAVVEVNIPWIFNQYVNKIPYTQWDQDFDGVCTGMAVKATKSWSYNKSLVTEDMTLINRRNCENILYRSCVYYYCTNHDVNKAETSMEAAGGGLICHGTGDPAEGSDGVLVGVTALVIRRLPTLHNRVGMFHDWVTNAGHEGVIYLKLLVVVLCNIFI